MKSTMTDEEIYEFITKTIEDSIDRRLNDEQESILLLRKEIAEDWLPAMNGIRSRQDQIENMINSHAQEVTNVFDIFNKALDENLYKDFIMERNKLTKKLEAINGVLSEEYE
jgi:hypothetical protein